MKSARQTLWDYLEFRTSVLGCFSNRSQPISSGLIKIKGVEVKC